MIVGCYVNAEKLMLGLPSAVTVIKDLDDAAAVAAARASISAPLITRTAATPQDSPKDVASQQMNNTEWSSSLQLPYNTAVIIVTKLTIYLLLTPTTVAAVKPSTTSVCLCVCECNRICLAPYAKHQ